MIVIINGIKQNLTAYKQSFTNSDLVGNVLTVTHGLGRRPVVEVYDNSDNRVSVDMTATTTQFTLDFGAAISGTWNLVAL